MSSVDHSLRGRALEWSLDDLLTACLSDEGWDNFLGEDPSVELCSAIYNDFKILLAQFAEDISIENARLREERQRQRSPLAAPDEAAGEQKKSRKRRKPKPPTSPQRDLLLQQQAAVVQRNAEVRGIIRADNHRQASAAERYRLVVVRLAMAIKAHQDGAGTDASVEDKTLWEVLDRETVPHGVDDEQMTLRQMLTDLWSDDEHDDSSPHPDEPRKQTPPSPTPSPPSTGITFLPPTSR